MKRFVRKTDSLLALYRQKLGDDYTAYRHHVLRVIFLARELTGNPTEEQSEKIVIAACFHDLGIWSADTFDYLEPSIALAGTYLAKNGLSRWQDEISLMISEHHKISVIREGHFPLAEIFRRADWIDVSLGLLTFGLKKEAIRDIRREFPNAGFHKRLLQLTVRELGRHPFNPLPMFKW